MPMIKRTVKVYQVPGQITASNERSFLQELKRCAETERPRFVLDCSRVSDMNVATIRLLLSCLEEVMKCNGDLRLASLQPAAEETLRLAGVNRLFEMYATTEDAVQSYHQRPTSVASLEFEAEFYHRDSGMAA